jgi:hypothetical protein
VRKRWGMSLLGFFRVAIFIVPLVGCADPVWVKPGTGPQDFQADSYSCERDARQSGGFGTGFARAVEVRDFFNRCMNAKGWSLQDRQIATASAQLTQSSLELTNEDRISCVEQVRRQTKFSPIIKHLPDSRSGRFSFHQMANPENPTAPEARLFADLVAESSSCRDRYLSSVTTLVTPAQLQILRETANQCETLNAQISRRQMSWGEFATRGNQIFDSATTKLQGR